MPMAGDMDGDGRADLVVYRAFEGKWYWADQFGSFLVG